MMQTRTGELLGACDIVCNVVRKASKVLELKAEQLHPDAAWAGPRNSISHEKVSDASSRAAPHDVKGTSLFFARVPPTVEADDIRALFERFGKVLDLNLFRPWATAKTSKGCGIVEFEIVQECVAAMDSLHNQHRWAGGETTMVVEWADPSRQRRENPDARGVFEAKHKRQSACGSRSRYRSQMMKRVLALGLQGGGCPPGMLGLLNPLQGLNSSSTSNSNRPLHMASRGVLAMAPQLAARTAPGAGGGWGMGLQGAAVHQARPALPATAVTTGMSLPPMPAHTGCCLDGDRVAAAGGLLRPGMSSLLPCQGVQLQGHTAPLMDTAQPHDSYAATLADWAAQNMGCASTPSTEVPSGPVMAYYVGSTTPFSPTLTDQLTAPRPGLNSQLLQQQQQQQWTHMLCGLGPAGAAWLMGEGCSGAVCCDPMVQQLPLSFLSASPGLVADASLAAAAAAAVAPQQAASAAGCYGIFAPSASCQPQCSCMGLPAGLAVAHGSAMLPFPSPPPHPVVGAAAAGGGGCVPTERWWGLQDHPALSNSSCRSLPSLVGGSGGLAGLERLDRTACLLSELAALAAGAAAGGAPPVLQHDVWDGCSPGTPAQL